MNPVGRKAAGVKRTESLRLYEQAPSLCRHCGKAIPVPDGTKICAAKKKIFCNRSCAVSFNNRGKSRGVKKPVPEKICQMCAKEFRSRRRDRKFCSRSCGAKSSAAALPVEELRRRGFADRSLGILNRQKQLAWEENVAQELRVQGWEVFSPTVVCDRIGVLGGKVYFLEFKPKGKTKLRSGQQRIADLVLERYLVIEG